MISLMITPRTRQTVEMMMNLNKSHFANGTLMNVQLSWKSVMKGGTTDCADTLLYGTENILKRLYSSSEETI
jgi:hypothetical protein